MDYSKIYNSLINRALTREWLDGYVEKHHIVPRCLGGSNDSSNLVRLTAEEHFIAHLLLVKIFPTVSGLTVAVICLSRHPEININNKAYGWLKRKHSELKKGKRHTEATKKLISDKKKGTPSPNKGKAMSDEQKQKISIANTGRVSKKRGVPMSDEQKKKVSASLTGKKQSAETIEKRAAKARGRKVGPPSDETKQKISDSLKGRKLPPESRAKQIESIKRTLAAKRDRKEILQIWQAM
jgi:hypothetical protein